MGVPLVTGADLLLRQERDQAGWLPLPERDHWGTVAFSNCSVSNMGRGEHLEHWMGTGAGGI